MRRALLLTLLEYVTKIICKILLNVVLSQDIFTALNAKTSVKSVKFTFSIISLRLFMLLLTLNLFVGFGRYKSNHRLVLGLTSSSILMLFFLRF